jgi:hypothetical protein
MHLYSDLNAKQGSIRSQYEQTIADLKAALARAQPPPTELKLTSGRLEVLAFQDCASAAIIVAGFLVQ